MRFQPVAARIAPAALALLLSAFPAFGAESAAPAEKPPASAADTADKSPANTAETPAAAPSPQLPNIVSIRFVGNEHFSKGSLKRDLDTRANKPVDVKVLSADVDRIVKKYEDDGFLEAKVNATSEHLPGTADQELLFSIVEGPRYKLSTVEIIGNKLFSTLELRPLVEAGEGRLFFKAALSWTARSASGSITARSAA